jgi:uncharacterized protein YegL
MRERAGLKSQRVRKHGDKKAYIALVLDESGSMYPLRETTISNYNEQLQQIQKDAKSTGVDTYVTLIVFSNHAKVVFANEPVSNLDPVNSKDYDPSGMTALRDGMMLAISTIEESMTSEDSKALVVTLTDGAENYSTTPEEKLKRKISACKESGRWTFCYLGTSEESIASATKTYGFSSFNTRNFIPSRSGLDDAYSAISSAASSFLSNVANDIDDNESLLKSK